MSYILTLKWLWCKKLEGKIEDFKREIVEEMKQGETRLAFTHYVCGGENFKNQTQAEPQEGNLLGLVVLILMNRD